MANRGHRPVQSGLNPLGRPQVFVQLSFGVSWSERHVPQSHSFSYTSKNLKNARDSGHFPRQPLPEDHQRHQPEPARPRGRPARPHSRHLTSQASPPLAEPGPPVPLERGCSAPAPLPEARLGGEENAPSATLFSRPVLATVHAPALWNDQPPDPASFRLSQGLPWSVSAWPSEPDNSGHELPLANVPTVVPLLPLSKQRGEDPQRVRELASLSTAMMTVDNGFENQWWNQGERQPVGALTVPPRSLGEDHARFTSMDDALLLSPAEPPSAAETYSATMGTFNGIVSPISDPSPTFTLPWHIHRSFTSRSDDELWMGR
ncbi:hypothetical protein F5Y17DRAFT_253729 [Xylariaceae sp. FL0594]|nr:hypothetical protein F5Y17DRAFT_253729 [Xylariaceae sp. FL0594]